MAGRTGYGVTITVDGSAVGEATSITVPGASASAVNINYLAQSSGYNQYIGGMKDGGTISVEANWTATAYATLIGKLGTLCDVVVTVGTVVYAWTDALCTKVGEMGIEIDGVMKAKFEFMANGAPTVS